MTYPMTVAGLRRDLPICKVTDDLYIGAFIVFGDAELTVACARELLKLVPAEDYDYMLTAEAKSIPLIHEMAASPGRRSTSSPGRDPRLICRTPSMWRIPPSPPRAPSGCTWAGMTRR